MLDFDGKMDVFNPGLFVPGRQFQAVIDGKHSEELAVASDTRWLRRR